MEKKITADRLGENWNQRKIGLKPGFLIFQLFSSLFSAISGILVYTYVSRYPAASFLRDASNNLSIGTTTFGGISSANIGGTIISSIGKPKKQIFLRILIMVISVIIGLLGFIGISRASSLGCIDLGGPFGQCTKYGVHKR